MSNINEGVRNAYLFGAVAAMLLTISSNSPSFAGNFRQNHPRRAEVLGRSGNLSQRINSNYGSLGGRYGRLSGQNRQIASQEQMDARNNGGYITKGQQGQLNREQNSLSKETFYANKNNQFVQNHPRRSQVMGRDANLNYAINKNQGNLGGNYKSLEQQDRSIAQQQRADAAANGGYITQSQRQQLNQEESALRNQITQDK